MISIKPFNLPSYPCDDSDIDIYSNGYGLVPQGECNDIAIIKNTTLEKYLSFTEELSEKGFEKISEKSIDENLFYVFKGQGGMLYTRYTPHLGEVKLISDTVSCDIRLFSKENCEGNGEIKLFSFPVTEGHQGDLYFISLPNGEWIIIDGSLDPENEALSEKLFEFLSLRSEGKIKIALWWITHGHRDHFRLFEIMLENHPEWVDIERIMFNETDPKYAKDGNYEEFVSLRRRILNMYPDILFLKPHTGDEVNIGDVKFEFLYTQEDNLFRFVKGKEAVEYPLCDFNLSCSVAKMYIGDMTFFALGDYFNVAEFVPNAYSPETYLCDIYKCAHHGFNKQHLEFYLETAKSGKISYFLINNDKKTIDSLERFDKIQAVYGERMIFTERDIREFKKCDGKILMKNYEFI